MLDGLVSSWSTEASVRAIVQRQQRQRNSFSSTQATPTLMNHRKPQHHNDLYHQSVHQDIKLVLYCFKEEECTLVKIKNRVVDDGILSRDVYVSDHNSLRLFSGKAGTRWQPWLGRISPASWRSYWCTRSKYHQQYAKDFHWLYILSISCFYSWIICTIKKLIIQGTFSKDIADIWHIIKFRSIDAI
jgi:hypothetical protein